ncbi:hypothetical protein AAG570_012787 [Ranatra chinensis]|uniref:Uncharacterized protein n=1 Tax=Ranatra chinensis TaxID=642074 RepID=A0ABD0YEW9_9HEMI
MSGNTRGRFLWGYRPLHPEFRKRIRISTTSKYNFGTLQWKSVLGESNRCYFRFRTTSGAGGTILPQQLKANGAVGSANVELSGQHLGDIQSLFLHHPAGHAVKREPEDLSHHRKNGQDKGRQHKVVLVTAAGHSDLVVDVVDNNNTAVKDEFVHSPRHGGRSIDGTPSSTSSLMAQDAGPGAPVEIVTAEGLKSGLGYGGHVGGSGSPSPVPYAEHQYGQAASGYATASAGRSSASSGFAGDPYYREYFAEQPSYAAQLRQVPGGGGGGGAGAATAASFVERYVRQSTAYQNKGVIAAAGLTVDLPSPDSGIGADAITPRDQAAIQQVGL